MVAPEQAAGVGGHDLAALAAITDPIQRAIRAAEIARVLRYWPTPLADLRRRAVAEVLADGSRKRIWVAKRLGLSSARVSQLAKRAAQMERSAA